MVLLFFSCMQLILIFQINKASTQPPPTPASQDDVLTHLPACLPEQKMHISDLWFALGDNSAADFVMAVQFLPMVKMYLQLCPDGAEGTTYAMLTTYGPCLTPPLTYLPLHRVWSSGRWLNRALLSLDDGRGSERGGLGVVQHRHAAGLRVGRVERGAERGRLDRHVEAHAAHLLPQPHR